MSFYLRYPSNSFFYAFHIVHNSGEDGERIFILFFNATHVRKFYIFQHLIY